MNSAARAPAPGSPGLEFLPNEADEVEGLGDAGIETYKDNPYASLARECGQNSNDAAAKRPVVVSYDLIEIDMKDVPGCEKLYLAIDACLQKGTHARDEKTIDFFKQAKKILGAKTIKCVRVSDYNTKGLVGPCVEGTPFHALLKGSGSSEKDSETSSGSFGIGKNAAFANSHLQTVFYSTAYHDASGKRHFLAQGKCKLISHVDNNGSSRRATGYWGNPNGFLPVEGVADVPAWLRRDEIGTSVFALGFREAPNWHYRMTYSLVANFFVALKRERMRFEVNDRSIIIDATNVERHLHDPKVEQAAVDDDQLEDLQFARDLYQCFRSPETIETRVEIPELGAISVRVLVKEGLPKRVAIVRNGMMITDNLKHFGDKFSRFPMYRDFVALVEPLEDQGSALIKKLENPRHDELSAERVPDPAKMAVAKRAMGRLAKAIREIIKTETAVAPEDEVPLDEMGEFFSDGGRSERPPAADAEADVTTMRYQPVRSKPPKRSKMHGSGQKGGAGGSQDDSSGGGGGKGSGTGTGSGGSGPRGAVQQIDFNGVRHTRARGEAENKRTIYFTPTAGGIAKIILEAGGLNEYEKLIVVKTNPGEVVDGELLLRLEEGKRMSVHVEFSEKYDGPIEMSAVRIAGASK